MNKYLKKALLFFPSVLVGFGLYYFAPLSSIILEKAQWGGKMTIQEAKDKVAVSGWIPLYGWYQVKGLRPTIVVMVKKDGVKEKRIVNMWGQDTGEKKVVKKKLIDTTAPVVKIIWPVDEEQFENTTTEITVQVEVTDDVDPNPTVSGDGKFVLKAGWNVILVSATDAAGNFASQSIIVHRTP